MADQDTDTVAVQRSRKCVRHARRQKKPVLHRFTSDHTVATVQNRQFDDTFSLHSQTKKEPDLAAKKCKVLMTPVFVEINEFWQADPNQ